MGGAHAEGLHLQRVEVGCEQVGDRLVVVESCSSVPQISAWGAQNTGTYTLTSVIFTIMLLSVTDVLIQLSCAREFEVVKHLMVWLHHLSVYDVLLILEVVKLDGS